MHRVRAPPVGFSSSARFTPLTRPTRVMSLERTRVQPQWALKRTRPTRGSTQPCTTSKVLPRNHLARRSDRNNKSPHFATSQKSGFVAGTQNNKPSSTAKRNAAGGEATCQTRALSLLRDTVLATRFAFDRDGRGCNTLHAACERFLACVVEGAAQQVQLARGAHVATEQATTHAQLQTSSRKPKKLAVYAHSTQDVQGRPKVGL